jgi:hypothetical protein
VTPTWVAQGPAPILDGQPIGMSAQGNPDVGAVQAVAIDPHDASLAYLGSVNGGIWKSTDAGAANLTPTWTLVSGGLPSQAIGDLTISPLASNVIYAGTGNFTNGSFGAFGVFNGGAGTGVYKSTDSGKTWQTLGASTFADLAIRRILPTTLSSGSGQVVLAAVPAKGGQTQGMGLYMSPDGGNTWTLISGTNGLPAGSINDVEEDPTDPHRFFAGVFGATLLSNNGIYVGNYDGASGQITWAQSNGTGADVIPATILADPNFPLNNLKISVVDNAGSPLVYVLTAQPGQPPAGGGRTPGVSHVFVSDSVGARWTNIDFPKSLAPDGINIDDNEANALALAADPTSPYSVFISGSSATTPGFGNRSFVLGASVSTGLVATWSLAVGAAASDTISHSDARAMVFDPDGNLVLTNDGGIYRLLNPLDTLLNPPSGASWVAMTGNINTTEYYSVGYDAIDHVILGGAQDNGSAVQTAPGSTTWVTTTGDDVTHVAVDNSGPQAQLYVMGSGFEDFDRATYNGANRPGVVPIALAGSSGGGPLSGLILADQGATEGAYIPFALNAVQPHALALGLNGLYESTNQGDTITNVTPSAMTGGYLSALAYGGSSGGVPNPDVLYAAVNLNQKDEGPSELFLRTGPGSSFVTLGNFASTIRSIVLDPADWRTAYLVLTDQILQIQYAGTAAMSMTDITGNLGSMGVKFQSVLVYNPTSTPGAEVVLVGTLPISGLTSGVYLTTNPYNGANTVWTSFGTGLPGVQVHDLQYNAQDNVLVAGTFGRGAWIITQAGAYLPASTRTSVATTLVATPSPATAGQPLALTTTVAAAAGVPSGTVAFYDGATLLGTVPLAAGSATLTISNLAAGDHTIVAQYSGDANNLPGQASVSVPIITPPAPVVTGLSRSGVHLQPTRLVLTFSTPLNAPRAQDLSAYRLVLIAPGPQRGSLRTVVLKLKSAVYDPARRTVTLTPRQRLNLHRPYMLTVKGTGTSAIESADGQPLDGRNNGQPGSDYQALILGSGPLGTA